MDGHILFVILMFFVPEIPAQALLPPALTVNPALISETDSVSLHCQPPPSVSVYQCYFSVKQETTKGLSCQQNLSATELLLMSRLSSPAEVKVRCFYTVKYGDQNSPPPYSNPSSIVIQSQTPQMSVQHFDGKYVLITCSLPGSVKDDTKCNLYFGEASRPTVTRTVRKKSSSITKQKICQFYVEIDDFLRHLHFVQQKEASCDYSLQSAANSLSPRSDGYNLKDIVEKESPKTNTKPAATMNTESSPTTPSASSSTSSVSSSVAANLSPVTHVTSAIKTTKRITGDSTTESSLSRPSASTASTSVNSPSAVSMDSLTPSKTPSSTHITAVDTLEGQILQQPGNKAKSQASLWKLSAAATGFGVTVGVILLVLGLLASKKRTERNSQKRKKNSTTGDVIRMRKNKHGGKLSTGTNGASGGITSVPDDRCLNGAEKLNWKETKNEDSDIYHVYATISEEPAAAEPQDMIYSMLQAH